ncbi:Flp family type IVb pilin [Hephaestia sp. GCM10023244]|uniref:Flp family type IVb pilin n=1 Tax=unclassified Hephaestia TaxID=2631281 RepID=UPI002076EEED|nr:Flp family type IVb pilin [Hephaestia sp. MAHUQ-44]MCM8729847.1 Flp family type IVb pilin [Hephaestia sp. MAHUQ-44]
MALDVLENGAAMLRFACKLYRNRKGGAAIEYGFMCALIVLAMMVALTQLADVTTNLWNTVDKNVATHGKS